MQTGDIQFIYYDILLATGRIERAQFQNNILYLKGTLTFQNFFQAMTWEFIWDGCLAIR